MSNVRGGFWVCNHWSLLPTWFRIAPIKIKFAHPAHMKGKVPGRMVSWGMSGLIRSCLVPSASYSKEQHFASMLNFPELMPAQPVLFRLFCGPRPFSHILQCSWWMWKTVTDDVHIESPALLLFLQMLYLGVICEFGFLKATAKLGRQLMNACCVQEREELQRLRSSQTEILIEELMEGWMN